MLIDIFTAGCIIAAHTASDFALQRRVDAESKSSSWYHLSIHMLCYMVAMITIMGLFNLIFNFTNEPMILVLWIFINVCHHFFIDSITSRQIKYYYENGNTYVAINFLGLDQFFHIFTLLFTWAFFFPVLS